MPCKCSGIRYDRCACMLCRLQDDRVMIVQDSASRSHPAKRSFWVKVYENVYERCAGFNLRYCPFRGVGKKNFVKEAVRDLVTLLCFVLANLVVFLTIFTRMAVHVSFAMVASARWMRRSLLKKVISQRETMLSSRLEYERAHNFSPPKKMF